MTVLISQHCIAKGMRVYTMCTLPLCAVFKQMASPRSHSPKDSLEYVDIALLKHPAYSLKVFCGAHIQSLFEAISYQFKVSHSTISFKSGTA